MQTEFPMGISHNKNIKIKNILSSIKDAADVIFIKR